jgi:hypothetical protein
MGYQTQAKLRSITDKDGKDVYFVKIVIQETDKLPKAICDGVIAKMSALGIKLEPKTLNAAVVEMLNQVQHDSYKALNGLVVAGVPVRKDVKSVDI